MENLVSKRDRIATSKKNVFCFSALPGNYGTFSLQVTLQGRRSLNEKIFKQENDSLVQ